VFGAASLALIGLFIAREATARNPLIPLRIFKSRNVSGANAIQAVSVAGMFAMFFMGALYFQKVLGYDALQTGLAFLPATVGMGALSVRYSERLVMRFGARNTLIPGLVSILGGLLLFTQTPVGGDYLTHGFAPVALIGVGAGLAFPALMTLAMSGATPEDAGLASGLVNTTAQVGGALGLAVLATVASSRTESLTKSGDSALVALNGGYHLAYLIGAGLVVVGIVISWVVLRPERSAAEAAEPAREKRSRIDAEPAYDAA
jgi:MFS family permease